MYAQSARTTARALASSSHACSPARSSTRAATPGVFSATPTLRAKIDTQSTLWAAGTTPQALIRPLEGLRPTMLFRPAGTRPKPAVSVPSEKSTSPAATV